MKIRKHFIVKTNLHKEMGARNATQARGLGRSPKSSPIRHDIKRRMTKCHSVRMSAETVKMQSVLNCTNFLHSQTLPCFFFLFLLGSFMDCFSEVWASRLLTDVIICSHLLRNGHQVYDSVPLLFL